MDYKRKIDFAIKLLRSIPQDGPIEVSYSGGKDSDVILELTKMSGIPYRAIYKNTTIDPPGTIAHAKSAGAEVINPKHTFFDLVKDYGLPSRYYRFCCSVLKEYKVLDRAIQGIRRSESTKRKDRYKEPEYCRTYSKNEKARIYLPILEWTDEDVSRFVDERGIKCHPLYYDRGGNSASIEDWDVSDVLLRVKRSCVTSFLNIRNFFGCGLRTLKFILIRTLMSSSTKTFTETLIFGYTPDYSSLKIVMHLN